MMERSKVGQRKGPDTRPALVWMCGVAGKAKLYIGALLAIQAILGLSGVANAMLLRELVNAAVDGRKALFAQSAFWFAGVAALQVALRAVGRFVEEYSRSSIENRFKERLFSALLTRDYAAVTQVNSGEWMNRLTSDTVVAADGMVQILPGASGMAVRLVGALAAILYLKPSFVYILVPGGVVMAFFTYGFRKILKRLHKKIQESDGRLRVFLQERLGSLMIVRAFAQEDTASGQAVQLMDGHQAARMKRNHFSNLCNIGFGAAMNGAYVLGAVFCGYGILAGTMSYGNLMAILQLIGQVQNPFANITGYLPRYYAMVASAERLMEAEGFGEDDAGSIAKEECQKFYRERFLGIGMEDASFTYQPPVAGDGEESAMPVVLEKFCLEVNKGEYVAFTGPSGCGKSTVLKLLMCFYPLDGGAYYMKSDSGRQAFCACWRSLFAYVPQGNQLMSGTIREIIAFGDAEDMEREDALKEALRIACADGFVGGLEQGLDTLLGERGTGISEGQMQRIAIARAIFSGRPILLLDEATSSLDEGTEKQVLANLRAMTDKTVVIVTHRPAVLSICDKNITFS